MNKVCVSLLMALAVAVASCDKPYITYSFVGDSIITRWDLQESFPVLVTRNYGESGSGLKYLQSQSGRFGGGTVIVISGANDVSMVSDEMSAEKYAEAYVDAVSDFGAEKVYVFSIMPRNSESGSMYEAVNERICMINSAIRSRCIRLNSSRIVYIDVYNQFLGKDNALNANLSYDGLHLNPEGYRILTNELNRYIQ